jgi:5-methylcytosine-specific restriction endonuclease McrA
MNELIFDAILGAWIWIDIYKTEKRKNSFVNQALKRGFFPYSFNFVFGKRGETAQCSFCGKFLLMREMTRDHVYPKSLGGIITTTACYECNTQKKDVKPIEFAIWASETGFALRD